jgi:glycosyltransferase involved in cell wall biosynthesis
VKILVVTRSTPWHPSAGGMERAAWDLAASIAAREDVTVLTTELPPGALHIGDNDFKVMTVPGTTPGRYSLKWWIATARLDVSGYEAVLSVSAGATALIWLRRGPNYVFQAHGTAYRELLSVIRSRPKLWPLKALRLIYWTMLDRGTYRRAHSVVAIGPAVTEALGGWIYSRPLRGSRLHEIPNGIDVERLAASRTDRASVHGRYGFHESDVLAIVVARLTEQKGVDLAIQAVEQTQANLLIIGDGDAAEALEQTVAGSGLGSKVRFAGELGREEIADVLHAADVLLFTPRELGREGLPLVVMEALAAHLPVVAPDGNLWPENIREQLTLVESRDLGGLAEQVRHAKALPRPSLPPEYDVNSVARKYIELFEER